MRIILDIPLSLSRLLCAIGNNESPARGSTVSTIVTDSREAREGDLFFALASQRNERETHVRDANARGAITVGDTSDAAIYVTDARRALLSLAVLYKSELPLLGHTVGITGSSGKTTATRFISRLLSERYRVHSTIGNYNNIIGLSLTVLCAPRDTEILVLEMGMNAEGEIRELAGAIMPDVCLITNIGTAHIGNLGSREAIARAKSEIVTELCTTVICPADEALLGHIPQKLTFSVGEGGDFSLLGECFASPFGTVKVQECKPYLRSAVCAAMAVVTTIEDRLTYFGDEVCELEGRATTHLIRGITVIDDSYNSSPEAVELMLGYLSCLEPPRSVLLSDMLELGSKAHELHFLVGKRISGLGIDNLFAVGNYAEEIARGAIYHGYAGLIRIYPLDVNLREVATDVLDASDGGHLLIKGSHATGLHQILEILKEMENEGI